jgi:uncharacterized damage-inducible protein DinB
MKKQLVDYVRYNLWVNARLVDLFQKSNDALISKEIESSFPSIRTTLIHLWDVEVLWLMRLKGVSPKDFPSKNFSGSNAEVYANLLAISKEFLDFVEKQPAKFFNQPISFSILSATGEFTHKPADMVHHCMNHQTFHRGQLITMARQVGITAFPRTDFIMYKREVEGK